MKKTFKSLAFIFSMSALIFISCEKDESEDTLNAEETFIGMDDFSNRTAVTDESLLSSIRSLDIDVGTVTVGDFHLPDGSVEERYYIGSDISFTPEDLDGLLNPSDGTRQYITFNLVEGNFRTIDILGYTGGSQALSSKAQTALQWAVDNYNNLNTSLQFNLTFGTNYQAADMVVYDNTINNPNGTGGVAGFPNSSGQPNKFIQIYGIEQFSTNVNEHVITHEIGHSVGFRHSDWFDRLSCPASAQGNEGSGSDGAVQVPGTPSGRDVTSVMQACFSTSEDGEFNANDVIALEYMYGETAGPCDGVPNWSSSQSYSVGDRVVYQGNLYERVSNGWTFLGPC